MLTDNNLDSVTSNISVGSSGLIVPNTTYVANADNSTPRYHASRFGNIVVFSFLIKTKTTIPTSGSSTVTLFTIDKSLIPQIDGYNGGASNKSQLDFVAEYDKSNVNCYITRDENNTQGMLCLTNSTGSQIEANKVIRGQVCWVIGA